MIPKNEYPRPQFRRNEWRNLNGEWSYAFDFSLSGKEKGWADGRAFDGTILVPFCPESKLSGVEFTDFIPAIWYQRELEIPAEWNGKRILIHFGGVDFKCIVYLDGREAGRHTGCAAPFTIDLTRLAEAGKTHKLTVYAEDDIRNGLQPFGKQSPWLKAKGGNYSRVTGIWQTVWMEAVHLCAMKRCAVTPDFDNGAFTFAPVFHQTTSGLQLTVIIRDNGETVTEKTVRTGISNTLTLTLENPKAWNPETPFLYDFEYILKDAAGNEIDRVESFAGLRKVHLENGRFYLNNEPVFLRFVLDQGFYEDGIWTAPDDESLKHDIELSMKAGFNGARLHQKIFDERFHYWADKLGYLTWAEYPSWGMSFWHHYRPTNPDYNLLFRNFFAEWTDLVIRDMNHPSIIAWTPFNETYSFHDKDEHRRFIGDVYEMTKILDPTRPVNDTSGGVHAKTDLWTVHLYAQEPELLTKQMDTEPVYMPFPEEEAELGADSVWHEGMPFLVDEYGGVSFIPEGRKPYADNSWGYNASPLTKEQAEASICAMTDCIVKHPKVTGYCYTQLTDIEQEQNGVYNYDRTEKFDMTRIGECFSAKPEWSRY